MAAALSFSRPLSKQLLARSTRPFTRPLSTRSNSLLRVTCNCERNHYRSTNQGRYVRIAPTLQRARLYATAAKKPASRPKAHTGRTAEKSKRPASTKKVAPAKKKPAKKPKKKAAVKKPTVKKPKVKKAPSKTALLTKARKEKAVLVTSALLNEPKKLPITAYTLILAEEAKKEGVEATTAATVASNKYKNLAPEEREQYNHEANANKEKNDAAYKKWVESHSPLEIKNANNARRRLNRQARAAGKKKTYFAIKDERLVKKPRNAYTFFSFERHASGDLKGMTISEVGKLTGQEWKRLSASERKPYEDKAQASTNQYIEEYKSVYGEDASFTKPKAK